MKNTDEGKPSRAITKSILFTVSKDEWDTKEDTGKSVKNALYVPKGTSRAEAMSSNEKLKPVALAVIELHLISQSGSQ